MSPFDYFKKVVTDDYANFEGRSRRSEYWYFFLFNIIISYGLSITAGIIGSSILQGLSVLYSLAVFIPSLAVAVRRLHDTDKSGWFILIAIIPVLGWIAIIVFLCMDSTPGRNEYGPNPKEDQEDEIIENLV